MQNSDSHLSFRRRQIERFHPTLKNIIDKSDKYKKDSEEDDLLSLDKSLGDASKPLNISIQSAGGKREFTTSLINNGFQRQRNLFDTLNRKQTTIIDLSNDSSNDSVLSFLKEEKLGKNENEIFNKKILKQFNLNSFNQSNPKEMIEQQKTALKTILKK